MKELWKQVGLALLFVLGAVAAFLVLPIFGRTAIRGVQTTQLINAKQLGTAVKLYVDDHEGHFPMQLSELVPDYLSAQQLADLQFEVREKYEDPAYAKQDWLYFGAIFDESAPPPILIASPQTTGFKGKPPKRIVIASDLTGSIISEDQYQIELKKTIEAMHQRARSVGLESKPNAEPANPNSEPQ